MILRRLFLLLLVLALPLAQMGSHLHALAHAAHDVAMFEDGGNGAPPLDHSTEKCLFFQAIGSAISGAAPPMPGVAEPGRLHRAHTEGLVAASPVPFNSRAPPVFS